MSRHERQIMVRQWIARMLTNLERAGAAEWMP